MRWWRFLLASTVLWRVVLLAAHEASHSAGASLLNAPANVTHIMFMTLAFRGHATPLIRMATELVRRGRYHVSIAMQENGRSWVEGTGGHFVSAGTFPLSPEKLQRKLRRISQDPSSYRGLLALGSGIYIPSALSMYDKLLPTLQAAASSSAPPPSSAHTEGGGEGAGGGGGGGRTSHGAAFAGRRPDLIVLDVGTLGAAFLATKLRIPYIVNNPTLLPGIHGSGGLGAAWSAHLSNALPSFGTG